MMKDSITDYGTRSLSELRDGDSCDPRGRELSPNSNNEMRLGCPYQFSQLQVSLFLLQELFSNNDKTHWKGCLVVQWLLL